MSISSTTLLDITGIQLPKDACVVIVQTEWNADNISRLREGCIRIFEQAQVHYEVITVPGAVEIPFAIKWHQTQVAASFTNKKVVAYIALGCVIKGDTPHFDYVCKAITEGVLQLNLQLPVPVIFGVLTVLNQQQIEERLGGVHGHKGEEAAITALKMAHLTNRK